MEGKTAPRASESQTPCVTTAGWPNNGPNTGTRYVVTEDVHGECDECGNSFTIDSYGITTHDENLHADRDHVTYSLTQKP
jgi:exo-beta-1,3-glucanase (GH17 family)